ncbi:MAG: DUF481 domain-containing protein [Nitrospirota bacterium]|nr:DUF481 domain-containing protein [Nitrospirota bacterium]
MKRLFVIAVLMCALPAHAQVNTEALRSDGEGLSGSLEFSLSNRTGNSDLSTWGAAMNLAHNTRIRTVLVATDVTRSKQRAQEIADRGFAHARWTRHLSRHVGWEVFAQHEYDSFALLDARTLAGTGPRFTLLDRSTPQGRVQHAFFGLAAMWEGERLDVPLGGPDDRSPEAVRMSSYLSLSHSWGTNRLSGTFYAQPRFGEPKDVRLLAQATLLLPVARSLHFKIAFTMRHDGEPPTGVRTTDTTVTNQLGVEF